MSFAIQSPSVPVVGKLLGAPVHVAQAGMVSLVTIAIPAAVADGIALTLEVDGVPTDLVVRLPAGATLLTVPAAEAVNAGTMLAWRVTAAGDVSAGATGLSLHTFFQAGEGAADWQLLFQAPGPMLVGNAAANCFGLHTLPAELDVQEVRVSAVAGGGEATVLQLFADGSEVDGLTITLPMADRDTVQTVTATWTHALAAGLKLSVAAVSGPAAVDACVTDVWIWLRLRLTA